MFDLPAELMYKIFTELHLSYSAEELETDDTLNFFPYTLADVCQTWRAMLSRSPEYWTHVVLDVNHPNPLPVDVFSWSRSLPLSVVVLSRSNSRDDRGKIGEHRHLSEITTALIPHVHRCHSISFQVTYESSLPPPMLFLSRDHTTLSSLHLDCLVQNGAASLPIGHYSKISNKLPRLKSVLLTGRAFTELCRTQPAWHEIWNNPLSLTISQYQFPRETTRQGDTITEFTKYLGRMRGLKDLKLKRLSLGYTPHSSPLTQYPEHFSLNSLHLEDLSHNFLAEFFKMVAGDCEQITISGCSVPAGDMYLTTERNLILEGINDKATIKSTLLSHRGTFLTVKSCPAFDDNILSWMASDIDKDSRRGPAGWVTALDISDCPGATPSGLIPLIHHRAKVAGVPARTGRYVRLLPYLKLVTLSKKGPAPEVPEEHRRWFVGQMRNTHVMCNVQLPEGKIVTVLEA